MVKKSFSGFDTTIIDSTEKWPRLFFSDQNHKWRRVVENMKEVKERSLTSLVFIQIEKSLFLIGNADTGDRSGQSGTHRFVFNVILTQLSQAGFGIILGSHRSFFIDMVGLFSRFN